MNYYLSVRAGRPQAQVGDAGGLAGVVEGGREGVAGRADRLRPTRLLPAHIVAVGVATADAVACGRLRSLLAFTY